MSEPTTAAGRAFIERHGTGKALEVLAIEAEARAAAEAGHASVEWMMLLTRAQEVEKHCRLFIEGTFERQHEARARMALDDLRAALAAIDALREGADKP